MNMHDSGARLCRAEGYLSLHDDVRKAIGRHEPAPRGAARGDLAKVIPLFKGFQRD